MRLYTIAILFIYSLFLCAQQSFTPTDSVMAYMFNAMQFSKAVPQEKVYLHLDNTGYFMKERLWYKAYVVRADNNLPTDMSRVLYVELLTPDGYIIKKQKLHVDDNGEAHGDIMLDSIFATGFYEIRAYTRYMMNWGDDNCFSRVFPVFKATKTEGDYSKPEIYVKNFREYKPSMKRTFSKWKKSDFVGERPDSLYNIIKDEIVHDNNVKFYPEGGALVRGLPGRVAFTAYDDRGVNIDTDWMLTDEDGNPVGDNGRIFTVDGRGTFEVTPTGGELYLRMNGSMKKKESFMLPVPESEGCTMKADMLRHDSVRVAVAVSDSLQGRMLGYALMHNGKILLCDTITAREDFSLSFSRDAMPGGVNQLTLFDSSGRIRSERMMWIFPRQTDADSLKITTEMTRLSPCCKVELTLTAQPESSLSFSAMDAATMTGGKEGNIRTWMLLGSELKGYVRDPEYYFESDDAEHRMNADLLMMIQGWRRYDWHLMSGLEKFKKIQPIEDKLYLFGNLKAYRKRNTIDNVRMNVHLFNWEGGKLKGKATTDSVGYYAFELPDIYGEWEMQIFTKKMNKRNVAKLKTYYVSIDRHF